MTPTRTAIAALLLLSGAISAKAQDPAGTTPGGPTATGQAEPAPDEPVVRPKGGPLIDAATSQPAPAAEPIPEPVVPIESTAPAATAPVRPQPGTAIVPPPPSRPRPVQAAPRPLPGTITPRPAASVATAPPPPSTPPPPTPPPAPVAETETPPVAVERQTFTPAWRGAALPLLGLLAAAAVAAGTLRLRRMRWIARTRAALALNPRLDPADGTKSTSGLSLTAPPLAIRARLLPVGNG